MTQNIQQDIINIWTTIYIEIGRNAWNDLVWLCKARREVLFPRSKRQAMAEPRQYYSHINDFLVISRIHYQSIFFVRHFLLASIPRYGNGSLHLVLSKHTHIYTQVTCSSSPMTYENNAILHYVWQYKSCYDLKTHASQLKSNSTYAGMRVLINPIPQKHTSS